MKKLGSLFGFLLAAVPAIALAQDAAFDRIHLTFKDHGTPVDVTVTKSGKAIFIYPDHVVKAKLSPDEQKKLEESVKGFFLRGSPATDMGVPPGKDGFELSVNGSNGMRWVAKGPVDVLRGGMLPPVYHVLRDIQDFAKEAESATVAPTTGERLALPAPPERLALPAPAERLALPPGPVRLALPPAPVRLALPAPRGNAPREIVFQESDRTVEVLPATNEIVVTLKDGYQIRTTDPTAVQSIVDAVRNNRIVDQSANAKVLANDSQSAPFKLMLQGEDGKLVRLQGPTDVSSWKSAKLQESVGPIVKILSEVGAGVDRAHQNIEAVKPADATAKKGFLDGVKSLIDTFKTETASIHSWGEKVGTYLKTEVPVLFAKGKGLLASMGDFLKNAWDRFRNRDAKTTVTDNKDEAKPDARGFTRTDGMSSALDGRIQAELDHAAGKDADAP